MFVWSLPATLTVLSFALIAGIAACDISPGDMDFEAINQKQVAESSEQKSSCKQPQTTKITVDTTVFPSSL